MYGRTKTVALPKLRIRKQLEGRISNFIRPTVAALALSASLFAQLKITSATPAPVFGHAVTLTASDPGESGPVSFMDNGVLVGVGTLNGGIAHTTTITLPAGEHSLRAIHQGQSPSPPLPYIVT